MFDQRLVLLDFLPLVKLKRDVLNYISKCKRNGLSLVINCTMSMKRPNLVSLKFSPNPIAKNP